MLLGLSVQAQSVTNYSMTYESGTFTPLTDATVLESGSLDDYNNKMYDGTSSTPSQTATGAGYSLGFTFTLGNDTFTNFIVNTNGYIILRNSGDEDYDAGYSAGSTYYNAKNMVSALATAAGSSDSTKISYKVEGEEGNHVLTVEFLNVDGYGYSVYGSPYTVYSVQLKLYEDGNKVQVVYGPCSLNPDNSYGSTSFYVGIYKDGSSQDLIAKGGSWDNDETTTYYGGMSMGPYSTPETPATGTTYTFAPPLPCVAPETQPTNLKLGATSSSVSGSFNATVADQYLVLLSNGALTSEANPADGVQYNSGDSLGNAIVVQMSADSTFTYSGNVKGGTEYTVTVFAANTKCSGGPDYRLDEPLSSKVTTLPGAPDTLALADADSTQLVLTAKAIKDANVVVAYSDHLGTSSYGSQLAEGDFGTPSGDLKSGDEINGGGKVVYVGEGSDNIAIGDLQPGKLYHFKAWTKQDTTYSSTALTASAFTASKLPWDADLNSLPTQTAPLGWNVGPAHSDRGWVVDKDNSWGATDTTPFLQNYGFEGGEGGVETWLETPYIYLSDIANRLIFELRLVSAEGYYSSDPYTWNDSDSVTIQATTDGKTYTTVSALGKNDLPEFTDVNSFKKLYTTFYELAGKKARLRIGFKLYGKATITLRNIKVEEKGQCDYPINVAAVDSTIVGDEAAIDWTSQGDENAWEIQYKKNSTDTWKDAPSVIVQEHPYKLTGLDGKTVYDVRVRALCSETQHSSWSDVAQFTSGLAVPFTEEFANEETDPGWKSMRGKLGTPSELTEGGLWTWEKDYYETAAHYNASYSDYTQEADDWYVSPKFDLGDGSWKDTATVQFNFSSYAIHATDYSVYLVVAKDGENFNAADTVLALHNADLKSDTLYTVPLEGYTGKIRLGVLLSYSGGTIRYLTLTSVGVYGTKDETPNAISSITRNDNANDGRVYTVDGRFVADKFDATKLPRGMYIVGHKKIVIR